MQIDVPSKGLVLIHLLSSMKTVIRFMDSFIKTIPLEVLNACTFQKKMLVE